MLWGPRIHGRPSRLATAQRRECGSPPHILTPDHGLARAGPTIVDFDALACKVDTYLKANPEPELSRCIFYVLANTFAQLSRIKPLPPEAKF
jgi:hypothetical protein